MSNGLKVLVVKPWPCTSLPCTSGEQNGAMRRLPTITSMAISSVVYSMMPGKNVPSRKPGVGVFRSRTTRTRAAVL